MPLLFDPPDDPRDTRDWTREVEEVVAGLVVDVLTAMVTQATDDYIASFGQSLTAAGDLSAFDGIPGQWQTFVVEEFADTIGGIYLNGALTAFVQAESTVAITEAATAGWTAVVNQDAVAYSQALQNRMRDVGDRLWLDLRETVTRGITEGMSIDNLSTELQKVSNFGRYRAEMIARTEVHASMNAGKIEGDLALGEYGPVEKVWLSGRDARVRETHVSADGQYVPITESFTVGGAALMFPGDPAGPAREVINCRCTYLRLWPGDERPDGSIVPERIGQQAQQLVQPEIEAAQVETTRVSDVRQLPSEVNRARLDPDHFATAFDDEWITETLQGRQLFEAADNNDAILRRLMRDQGFNARPTVVSDEVFDQLEDNGWTVAHRGINAPSDADLRQYVDNFLIDDDPYVGRGLHGNGIYTTTVRETAQEYANTSGLGIGSRGEAIAAERGVVMDIAIHPQARIVDRDDLYKIREKRADQIRAQRAALDEEWPTREVPHPYRDGETMVERVPLDDILAVDPTNDFAQRALRSINYDNVVNGLDDIGKIAAMEGVDVVRVVNPRLYNDKFELVELPDTYYVIINRGAVAVREVQL